LKHCASRCLWGTQAASLSFSAACRKALRTCSGESYLPCAGVVGKLPTTAG
jgi:hypothetical protein